MARDRVERDLPSTEDPGLLVLADQSVPAPIENLRSSEKARRHARNRAGLLLVMFFFPLLAALGYWKLHRASNEPLTPRPRTLAVLPFQNLSHDANSDFLGFSLADAVITKLGYVGVLTVRPSSAIEKYRDQTIDIQRVGAELKVDTC